MKNCRIKHLLTLYFMFVLTIHIFISPMQAYDLSRDKVQYVVSTSHLDTQWLWTINQTRMYFLPATTFGNFYLFDKYPDYIFNYESAYHYMLIKKHYPEDFANIKEYAAKGNWRIAGGMLVACDVNVPSPESLVRQMLYGNGFFQAEFGRKAIDVFLPDCFGFGAALPTVATHCGMIGFSTQKVYCPWLPQPSAAYPKPFDIGLWQGVDGSGLIAAVNPGSYVDGWDINEDQINTLGETTGIYAAYDYMGVGDIGGACCCGHRGCTEEDVRTLFERIKRNDREEIKVVLASSDRFFKDLNAEQKNRLVKYKGELLAREHGVGTYTSKAAMKLKNRQNELGGYSAECAAVMAELLTGKTYPGREMKESWIRFLWHQMHDDLTGTSISEVYSKHSIPDENLSLEQFNSIRESSLQALAEDMDTRGEGFSLLVFNPLNIDREDPVSTEISFSGGETAHAVRVFDHSGNELPSQILGTTESGMQIVFLANVPSCGVAVFDIRESGIPCSLSTGLSVTESKISNKYLEVIIDENGDIAGITDLETARQVLSAPMQLELLNDIPDNYPQWEIRYEDLQSVLKTVSGPVKKTIIEQGPVRATLRIERKLDGSTFIQDLSLSANGRRIEVKNKIDWQSSGTLLKAAFTFNISNPTATYDLQLGTMERGTNTANLYEVPAHQWADITDPDGGYGVAVLNDCKYGWDKPADNKIRLTLIHTPEGASDLDLGENRLTYAVYPHQGDWRDSDVVWQAARLNQPLFALPVTGHDGSSGSSSSLIRFNSRKVALMAVKKAENDSLFVIRVRELDGANQSKVACTFPLKIIKASEMNGLEERKAGALFSGNDLVFDIGPYQVKTFALELKN
jgi:alpha-mannosidase